RVLILVSPPPCSPVFPYTTLFRSKLEDITHMIRSTVSEGHKVLIFSQFVRHLTIVKEFLSEEGISFSYLDGNTKDRKAQVEAFQEDSSIQVFLISLKAGGV